MSSLQVRQSFEAAWASLLPALTLYATSNDEPDRTQLPDNWATVDYAGVDDRVSIGASACWREQGTITVVVFGLAGTGATSVVTLVDQVRDAFRDWKDLANNIFIHRADPAEGGTASDGRWFGAAVSLHYQYDRVI